MYLKAKAPKRKKQLDAWIKAIPESKGHGSGSLQKRLWRIVSDYVRIRDFHTYGTCVATGRRIERWQEGQAGHFISYSKSNGLFKFDERNIHLQTAQSNAWGDRDDWNNYEDELKARGIDVQELERMNRDTPLKFTNEQILDKIKELLKKMSKLPEKPSYYKRTIQLLK